MQIDIPALNAGIALFTAYVAACLLLVSRQQWRQLGVRAWLGASALIALGHGLNACSAWGWPGWLVGDIAIHLIALGGLGHLWGCRAFLGHPIGLRPYMLAALAFVALELVLYQVGSLRAYLTCLWAGLAAVNLCVVLTLLQHRQQLGRGTLSVLCLGFGLVGLVYLETTLEELFFPITLQPGAPPHPVYVVGAVLLVAAQIAKGMGFLMLINARLEQSLRLAAQQDALTGTLNRRGFFDQALRVRQRAQASPWAVLMVDLDHFKAINDFHGHQLGDAVLQAVADRISGVLRSHDLIGRYGGEEFVVLLPGADAPLALRVAERMRQAVGTSPLLAQAPQVKLTLCVGIAAADSAAITSLDTLIAQADAALYVAKRDGRDRVQLHSDDLPSHTAPAPLS